MRLPAPTSRVARLLCTGRARWFHRRLDADLARGRSPWSDPALTARAARLTSREERRRLATSIIGLVRLAEFRRVPSPRLSIRHAAVLDEREALLSLAARLDADAPVPVDVVAQLSLLARDDASPVFDGGAPVEELAPIVRRCASAAQRSPTPS